MMAFFRRCYLEARCQTFLNCYLSIVNYSQKFPTPTNYVKVLFITNLRI